MSEESKRHAFPYIQPSQAQKHVTHNETVRLLDVLVQMSAISDQIEEPPSDAQEADCYIIPLDAKGPWAGRTDQIAYFENDAWRYLTPQKGWRIYVETKDCLELFDGSNWKAVVKDIDTSTLSNGPVTDSQKRFAVKTQTALWSALDDTEGGDGGLIQTLNKDSSDCNLGFVFQTGYQTRALLGQFGSETFRLTTSGDGNAYFDALSVDSATAIVDQPRLPRFSAYTNYDNYIESNTWKRIGINMTSFNDQGCFNASDNMFTAPVSGTFQLAATVTIKALEAACDALEAKLFLNKTTPLRGSQVNEIAPVSDRIYRSQTVVLTGLNAGDTVELQVFSENGNASVVKDDTVFWGHKVG